MYSYHPCKIQYNHFIGFSQNNKYEIPPLMLFCLDLLIFLTIPIMTHKTMIITIKRNTVTIGIVTTPTLETTARK